MKTLLSTGAVALLVGMAACGGSDTGPAATNTPTTAATTTTTGPPPSTVPPAASSTSTSVTVARFEAASLAAGWEFSEMKLELPPGSEATPGMDLVHGFAASSEGLVVAGKLGFITGNFRDPVMWFSADGEAWELVGEETFTTAEVNQVGAGGPGFVAAGIDCVGGDLQDCNAVPAIWTSPDGRSWRRVPHDPSIFPGCLDQGDHQINPYLAPMLTGCATGDYRPAVTRIAASDRGFMAVGIDPTWTPLWHSLDGLVWARVDRSVTPEYESPGGQGWSIYADDPGAWTRFGMVLPGFRCQDHNENDEWLTECIGDIWTSPGGHAWTATPWSDDICNEWLPVATAEFEESVVVVGNRAEDCSFCPVGYEPLPSAVVALHSQNGIEWEQASLPAAEAGRVWEDSLFSTPVGLIAMAENADQPTLAAMWHSADGRAWELVPALTNSPPEL
ncbi:MAG: hypothetical protein ACR2OI_10065, partial [Acidimicrobiia bacterium]